MSEEKHIYQDKDVADNKALAALSYAWILCFIPLLKKRDSKFVQFHAKQGMVLFILQMIGSLVFWFPLFGQLLFLGFLVLSVTGAIKAYGGDWWKMPYVYELGKKINL
jgi:fumarate reductase subunit D